MKIPQVAFGSTGLTVSRLCLGTGSSGNGGESVQGQSSAKEYAKLLVQAALDYGLTFWDTAFLYGTHEHIRLALKALDRKEITIASKSCTRSELIGDEVLRACQEMQVEFIDIFILHQVDSLTEWQEVQPALEALKKAQGEGIIRAVGLSTHNIDVLEEVVTDPAIDVVFTNYNFANVHMDADIKDYTQALEQAYALGKGVYVHKTLGAGKLVEHYERAVHFNLDRSFIHSVSVGITSEKELKQLIECFSRWSES